MNWVLQKGIRIPVISELVRPSLHTLSTDTLAYQLQAIQRNGQYVVHSTTPKQRICSDSSWLFVLSQGLPVLVTFIFYFFYFIHYKITKNLLNIRRHYNPSSSVIPCSHNPLREHPLKFKVTVSSSRRLSLNGDNWQSYNTLFLFCFKL